MGQEKLYTKVSKIVFGERVTDSIVSIVYTNHEICRPKSFVALGDIGMEIPVVMLHRLFIGQYSIFESKEGASFNSIMKLGGFFKTVDSGVCIRFDVSSRHEVNLHVFMLAEYIAFY